MGALKRPESYSLKDLDNNWQKKTEWKKNIREIESKEKYEKMLTVMWQKENLHFPLVKLQTEY